MTPDQTKCSFCSEQLPQNACICLSCGRFDRSLPEVVNCENHSDEEAIGICVLCGKPVCGDCSLTVPARQSRSGGQGKTFCDNLEHQTTFSEWAIVHETMFEFEAELIERNLQQAGFECRVYCLRDHIETFWLEEVRLTRVMVRNERARDARELLQQLWLIPDPHSSPTSN